VPVFHLVPQREAIHRFDEHLGNQQLHLLPLHHVQRLLAHAGTFHLIPWRFLQEFEHSLDVFRPVHNENLHGLGFFIFQAASAAAGIS
jgi:hypothetical protein